MKADVFYEKNVFVGYEGKNISEILDKVCKNALLNSSGRSKLTYQIYEKEEKNK